MDSKRNSGIEVFVCGDVCSHSFSSCNFPFNITHHKRDKNELLKKMTLEADEYKFDASEVERILKVWGEWIHEKPDTYSTLTKHQKKNWKNKEEKMEALLGVLEAKHVQRQE